ncbi:transcriptional regulator [Serratia ureilytica]|uniref:transcriptional regulator n=1 Tax=Serratia ureilytica TaxID=300181 RepID=UPI0034C693D4
MNYIIDGVLLFDSDKKLLSSTVNAHVSIPLTTTAARLLEEMLKTPNQVVSRSYLLKKVWEDNDYEPSDASLNNNISTLRKYFSSLCESEVKLITVPKVGFKLDAVISEPPSNTTCIPPHSDELKRNKKEHWGFTKKHAYTFLLVALLMLTIAFIFTKQKNNQSLTKVKKVEHQANYERCTLYNIEDDRDVDVKMLINKFRLLEDLCKKNSAHIYYSLSPHDNKRAISDFIAICRKSNSSGKVKCENIKSYSL